jgi:hypothetical protein
LDSKRLSLLINVSKLFFARLPGDLETTLKTRSSELFAINDEFRNIALVQENKLSITCFFERVETKGLGDVVRIVQVLDCERRVLISVGC